MFIPHCSLFFQELDAAEEIISEKSAEISKLHRLVSKLSPDDLAKQHNDTLSLLESGEREKAGAKMKLAEKLEEKKKRKRFQSEKLLGESSLE
jgi:hypothetical protein